MLALAVCLYCLRTKRPPDVPVHRAGPSYLYPHPASTPGAVNAGITQENIAETICSKTWSTSSLRPHESYTTRLKKKQMRDGLLTGETSDYEEDHLISLEVGGHPTDERNLWPEPYHTTLDGRLMGARQKDAVENYIHDEICFSVPDHKTSSPRTYPATVAIPLARGQEILAADWYACYLKMVARQPCQ